MASVQRGPVAGLAAQLVLLLVLAVTVGLGATGWLLGVAYGLVTAVALGRALARHAMPGLGAANRVTLTRAVLVGSVAALAAGWGGSTGPVLLALTGVALVLDAVDGWVARHTGTVTALGGRFDMEVDAFLILVLSILVARWAGPWVLLIGAARYLFVLAGWWRPWMRRTLPARPWRKVVTATAGIVLAATVVPRGPRWVLVLALTVAWAMVAESFGRDVWWLWVRHSRRRRRALHPQARRRALGVLWAMGGVLGWLALVAPDDLSTLNAPALARLPLEGVAAVAVLLVLPLAGMPWRARTAVAAGIGVLVALLLTLKVLDTGLLQALGRPLRPTQDWTYVGSGMGFLTDSVGRPLAVLVVGVGLVVWGLVLVLLGWSVVRLQRRLDHRPRAVLVGAAAAAVGWACVAATGLELPDGTAVASADASSLVARHVMQVRSDLQDRTTFARELVVDPFHATPASDLLQGLRGKDVLVIFVESYGRVAVEGSALSAGVDATLRAATSRLQASGLGSRSAFLTSPTFGGISWLAHSTLQSGLWVDSQERYDTLLTADRLTLSGAFRRAGWRTVDAVPSDRDAWPQGEEFYGFDRLYGAGDLGYAGPRFGYSTMPDQYVLAALQRLELTPGARRPVMAELDLTSSHSPWAPLPPQVPWESVGDGSVFDPMPAQGDTAAHVWGDPRRVAAAYAQSVEYSLGAVTSFLEAMPDPNLVVLMLGDHQPSDAVTGVHAGHDVPVTLLAKDPRVLSRIEEWGWQPGLLPSPSAPVWRMDAFRDRFLTAFSR